MKPTLILVSIGLLVILAGFIHERESRTATEVRKLREWHEDQARAAKMKHQSDSHWNAVQADLAKQQLLIERERDRKLSLIQADREADEMLKRQADLWKGIVGPEVQAAAEHALEKASAESERRLLGTDNEELETRN